MSTNYYKNLGKWAYNFRVLINFCVIDPAAPYVFLFSCLIKGIPTLIYFLLLQHTEIQFYSCQYFDIINTNT
jgi:hypothetical protein